MKKTIIISPQADGEAWVTAATEALSNEFGVEPTDDGLVCPFKGSGIGFKFIHSQEQIHFKLTNAYDQQTITVNRPVQFAKTLVCAIDVYWSVNGSAVAVCFRSSSAIDSPIYVIALNDAGECVGVHVHNTYVYFVRENEKESAKQHTISMQMNGYPAFSLVKFPDIFAGAMFDGIYLIYSAPTKITPGMIIHADNRDFVPVQNSGAAALAISV